MVSSNPALDFDEAVAWLESGGVVGMPTETVYGLAADACDEEAVAHIYRLKGRPAHNPLIVHACSLGMARTVLSEWSDAAEALAHAFWPGPLTLVMRADEDIVPAARAGLPTVGVRVPAHPVAYQLIVAFGGPLVAPSANPAGYVSPTTAEHVRSHWGPDEVMVLDGGPCRAGLESTVLSLVGDRPRILRPGVIGAGAIREVTGLDVDVIPRALGPAAPDSIGGMASPGQIGPHYRPRTPLAVLASAQELTERLARHARCAVLGPPGVAEMHAINGVHDMAGGPAGAPSPHVLIPMPREPAAYAARLYGALREADAAGAEVILVICPPEHASAGDERAIVEAIGERLGRATMA